jgi:hypothetical protein
MADIKSAWEIAQEKASKLGELSAEEREEQRQNRCRLIGESMAEKYLSHYDISSLEDELNKHSSQDRSLISQAVVSCLIQGIDLRYSTALHEISKGILTLVNFPEAIKTLDEIKELFRECAKAEDKERREIEKTGREMLHQMRVSGTAVGRLNIGTKEEWQKKLDQTAQPFDERLNYLKKELSSAIEYVVSS